MTGNAHTGRLQQGATLVVTLLFLMVVLLLGIAASHIALQGEKSSRNDRDHQIAFQAAEAALLDAEMDIEHSPDASRSRSHLFSGDSTLGFPGSDDQVCFSGEQNIFLGLCRHVEKESDSAWRRVDFLDAGTQTMQSVPYGRFTGQSFQTGQGSLPARPPRYIIELLPYRKPGTSADKPHYFYRVTAVGFGARETTQIALQTFYRKESR